MTGAVLVKYVTLHSEGQNNSMFAGKGHTFHSLYIYIYICI